MAGLAPEQIELIAKHGRDLIMVLDEFHCVRFASPALGEMLGLGPESVAGKQLIELIAPSFRIEVEALLIVPIEKGEQKCQADVLMSDGGALHTEIRMIPLDKGNTLGCRIVIIRDVSDIWRANQDLERRLAFEDLFGQITASFIDLDLHEVDQGINDALSEIGQFVGSDRAYLFRVDHSTRTVHNTYEWVRGQTQAFIGEFHSMSWDRLPNHMALLLSNQPVYASRLSDHMDDWPEERSLLEGIKSILVLPMVVGGVVVGLLGFDAVHEERSWDDEDIQVLRSTGDVLAHVLDRRVTLQTLKDREVQFRTLVENLPDPMIRVKRVDQRVFVNPALATLLGRSAEDLNGLQLDELGYPLDQVANFMVAMDEAVKVGRGVVMEHQLVTVSGPRWMQSRFVPESGDDGLVEHVLIVSRDITDRRLSELELQYRARHDQMTGLPNRALLLERVENQLERLKGGSPGFGVLVLDMDRFKLINDARGHMAGDEFLCAVGERLMEVVGSGHLTARLGGDEFALLIDGVGDVEELIRVAEQVHEGLSRPLSAGGDINYATCSIGLVLVKDPTMEPFDILRRADTAMYRAKERGRDRFEVFDEDFERDLVERIETRNDLRFALERGQFEVYFQPEVDLETGALVGVEALVRWHHPIRGTLDASKFIEVAEETGAILDLDAWTMQRACEHMVGWQKLLPDSRPLVLKVNLSAHQLAQKELVPMVGRILELTGMTPGLLCLEITETALMSDPEACLGVLKGLRGLGVQLAVDDFGTGYSSLSYLKRFPVHILKVDRSFVMGLPHDPDDVAIVRTIVQLADILGLKLTAEGIEDPKQIATLRNMHQMNAQGYLFAKALPAGEIEALITGGLRLPWAHLWPSGSEA
jgi:diguanylate cyclase (GGDEF)-like protein/PAS domain S-box-containing protein